MNGSEDKELKMLKGTVEDKDGINELSPLNLENNEAVNKKERKRSFKEKLRIFRANTTVEPIVCGYIMSTIVTSLATQNLNLEKACLVNFNLSDEICEALKNRQTENYTTYEEQVQTFIAGIETWKNIVRTVVPVLIVLFVGAWSDRTGKRKACILIPIFGELLACIGFLINTYFFYELPAEVAALTESIFPAVTGTTVINFIGVFSYIGDITSIEDRTYRVGIVNICMSLGYPVGSALSGVLLTSMGYYGVYSLASVVYLLCLIYGYFYLEDSKKKQTNEENQGCFGTLKEFFDIGLVTETFKVAFKKGSGNRRLRICLLLIVVLVVFGPVIGEFVILYLFTRFRFNWDEVQFSMWSTYSTVTNLIGNAFAISLFSNYLKFDDAIIGIMSNISKIAASFVYAFARTDVGIYMAPLLEMLNGTALIAMRSIASKLVTSDEYGRVNSLYGLAEALTPLLYAPLYSQVYVATISILPGAAFLLTAGLSVPAMIIFGWLYLQHQKDKKRNIELLKSVEMPKSLAC